MQFRYIAPADSYSSDLATSGETIATHLVSHFVDTLRETSLTLLVAVTAGLDATELPERAGLAWDPSAVGSERGLLKVR